MSGNRNKGNTPKAMSDQAFFSMLGFSNALPNIFADVKEPNYSAREIDDICKRYMKVKHEYAAVIIRLLNALLQFYTATDPELQTKREQDSSDEARREIVKAIGDALAEAEMVLGKNEFTVSDRSILYAAIDYSVRGVNIRLDIMSKSKSSDKIYQIYKNEDNRLKTVLKVELKLLKPS